MRKIIYILIFCLLGSVGYCAGNDIRRCIVGDGGMQLRHLTDNTGAAIDSATIVVGNVQSGIVYTLYRGTTKVAEQQGGAEGSDIVFVITPQLGQYYVKVGNEFMKGCITYTDYSFYYNDIIHKEGDGPIRPWYNPQAYIPFNSSGGMKEVNFTYDAGFVMSEFETILQMVNDGQMPYMESVNVPVRLFVKNHVDNAFTLRIECGPNKSDNTGFWIPIKFENLFCLQEKWGSVFNFPATFERSETSTGDNNYSIILTGSQYALKYRVYHGNRLVAEQWGNGEALRYEGITTFGEHTIKVLCYGVEYVVGDVYVENKMAQIAGNNWVRKHTYTDEQTIEYPDSINVNTDVVYYDGLGATIQNVSRMASPDGKDIVQPIYYDNMGRNDTRTYLPYSTIYTNGDIAENPYSPNHYVLNYGADEASYAFYQKEYEASPLCRVMEVTNVGSVFAENDKSVKYSYSLNTAQDSVYSITYDNENNMIYATLAVPLYEPKSLRRSEIVDEDGNRVIEFTDAEGHTILKRTIDDNGGNIDTYYVYDRLGRVAWIISPEGSKRLKNGVAEVYSYSYIYIYDDRGRIVEKKEPDKEAEYYIYDRGDRLILSQDGNERSDSKWRHTIYDNLSRVIRQEEVTTSFNRVGLEYMYSNGNVCEFSSIDTIAEYEYYKPNAILNIDSAQMVPVASDLFINLQGALPITMSNIAILSIDPNGIFFDMARRTIRSEYKICEKSTSGSYYYIPTEIQQALTFNSYFSQYLHYIENFPLPNEYLRVDYINPTDTTRYYKEFDIFVVCAIRQGYGIPELVIDDPDGRYFNHPEFENYLMYKNTENGVTTSVYGIPESDYMDNSFWDVTQITMDAAMAAQPGVPYDMLAFDYAIPNRIIPLDFDYQVGYMTGGTYEETEIDPLAFVVVEGVVSESDISNLNVGQKKYEKIAIFADGEPQFVERAFYYDDYGRLIQTVEWNHLGGISRYSMKFDFTGNVLKAHESHQISEDAEWYDTSLAEFNYDHRGRLLKEVTTANGSEAAVVEYDYDELGRLISKTYGNIYQGANTVTETYDYNIQGWQTGQSSDLFDMELKYYDPRDSIRPNYSGNIAEAVWQHKGDVSQPINSYGFYYDKLGRLTGYDHVHIDPLNGNTIPLFVRYTESVSYDANGNILYLNRGGINDINIYGCIARYKYDYGVGNRLQQVSLAFMGPYIPSRVEYAYDANGNTITDGHNGTTFEYNSLNLISKVSLNNSSAIYRWSADGTKLGVTDNDGNGFEYLGTFTYKRDATGLGLESIDFGSGILVASNTGQLTTNYHITDHLGSVRVMFAISNSQQILFPTPDGYVPSAVTILAQNDYFAFGSRHENPNLAQSSSNRYLFNGKESHNVEYINLLDYGARMYDASLGRWLSPDPLASMSVGLSPYVYCVNNPINYIDPDGRWAVVDDVLAALIGGIVNWATNGCQFNLAGLCYFGVGAAGTWAGLYAGPIVSGLIIGAGNSLVSQGFSSGDGNSWNGSNISGQQVLIGGIMGGMMGGISSSLGSAISPAVGNLFSGIGGQAVQQTLTQGVTGAAVGFTLNTGFALLNGASFEDALKAGGQGALMGFTIGAATGLATGLRDAYKAGENPWTGESLHRPLSASDFGVDGTLNRIDRGEGYPHRNDGSEFRNDKNILPEGPEGYYKEYVHPTPGANGPGLQRIVIGGEGAGRIIYYTPDHYKTFIPIVK